MKRYNETLYDAWQQSFSMDEVLFEANTGQQHLVIFKNALWGRVMALDGIIQTTEADEFIYHESLTHIPLFAHGNAKRVLIIGGGDGGMLREVCKHPGVEEIVMVEIDEAVVEMARTHLPNHSAGAFDDPRFTLVINDGARFVAETDQQFDVIISDSTDPIGPGEVLFTQDFYAQCKRCLTPGGVLVTQNGVPFLQPDELVNTFKRQSQHFADHTFYTAAVPTYVGGVMAFAWATDNLQLRQVDRATLQQRFADAAITTRYYTPDVHLGAFALPPYLADQLK
ncbi:polyamine aminopropyltransferase [Halioxenophilus sp. WMMB6]|uniref:polyamine aminopropyltransferase n=1 Tax=Halioxenophilus sp. WMMB6 TaxID=3073815 RepID=UPI00295E9D94|nr:polyamine aminopropyltransferase [Halioxenophilus sp. WMMB6]